MAHQTPDHLKYTIEHEWALLEDDVLTLGITDFAQSSLGDIVFMELPDVDTKIGKGESFGVVESIKSVSDLYSPVTGTIIESNSDLVETPEQCNTAPYKSWLIKVKLADVSEIDTLLSVTDYHKHCEEA
ncbi:MAG: glycine cleavage system protein GcvH [Bacteriovoracaceae bacterium]|jgi:glycine cleavage system H protein|nr:glycine cleavage system protein GcvH [Bacteriovoracaceae bacterium]